jgi:hypothetical protein
MRCYPLSAGSCAFLFLLDDESEVDFKSFEGRTMRSPLNEVIDLQSQAGWSLIPSPV